MFHKNLFLVETPLQLICAQEARDRFCAEEHNHLVVICRGSAEAIFHKTLFEADGGWSRVTHVRERTRRGRGRIVNRLWWTCVILARHGPFRGHVFTASPFRDWHTRLARLFGKDVTWLDDGAASIKHLGQFAGTDCLSFPNRKTPKFFTIFGTPELEKQSNGAIVQNALSTRRAKLRAKRIEADKLWFLGQPISGLKGISEEDELSVLERVVAEAGQEKTVIYIPHGAEKEAKLERISEFCTIYRPDICLESALSLADDLPGSVMSWFSTGLFTLKLLFPDIKASAIQLPLDTVPKETRDGMEAVYNYYAQFGISVRVEEP